MLYHYRHKPSGDPLLCNEVGVFFQQRMEYLAGRLTAEERQQISAEVGW